MIVATTSPDERMPNAAPLVAAAIGLSRHRRFDVGTACTGFVTARRSRPRRSKRAAPGTSLVIGADVMSRILDPDDRAPPACSVTAPGAVVVPGGAGRIGPVRLASDGDRVRAIVAGRAEGVIRMNGPDTYREAVDRLVEVTTEAVHGAGVSSTRSTCSCTTRRTAASSAPSANAWRCRPKRVVDTVPTLRQHLRRIDPDRARGRRGRRPADPAARRCCWRRSARDDLGRDGGVGERPMSATRGQGGGMRVADRRRARDRRRQAPTLAAEGWAVAVNYRSDAEGADELVARLGEAAARRGLPGGYLRSGPGRVAVRGAESSELGTCSSSSTTRA